MTRRRAGTAEEPLRVLEDGNAQLQHLYKEMVALMTLVPGTGTPGGPATGAKTGPLSDEDEVEAAFDNLPI